MVQKYSSKDTSVNVVNKVYKKYAFCPNSRILDYGGGKYDSNAEYMKQFGSEVFVFDKFNRSADHNDSVISSMKKAAPDYVVCSNVLNVILENEIIESIISDIASLCGTGKVVFAIYEGNRSGVGMATTKGYQRNMLTRAYLPYILPYFSVIKVKNGIIECERKQND